MHVLIVVKLEAGQSGNVGIVFYASSNNSLDELIQNGTDPPYIVVMSAQLFEEYVVCACSNNDSDGYTAQYNTVLIFNAPCVRKWMTGALWQTVTRMDTLSQKVYILTCVQKSQY